MMKEFEYKYRLPRARMDELFGILHANFISQGDFPESTVWNVYFDTLALQSYYETINSEFVKTKYRFRWYSDLAETQFSTSAFLEIKNRFGSNREKFRKPAAAELYELLRNSGLHQSEWSLLNFHELGSCYVDFKTRFPIHKSKYKRKRFLSLDGRIRLNIDYDLALVETNSQILHDGTRKISSVSEYCVLEIKSLKNLPPKELAILPFLEVLKQPFSKYSYLVDKSHSPNRWEDINERI